MFHNASKQQFQRQEWKVRRFEPRGRAVGGGEVEAGIIRGRTGANIIKLFTAVSYDFS